MNTASVHELRRIAEAVERLRDRVVQDVSIRSDCRQLKIRLNDGEILLVSAQADDNGRPRLDVDLVKFTETPPTSQLEVPFDGG